MHCVLREGVHRANNLLFFSHPTFLVYMCAAAFKVQWTVSKSGTIPMHKKWFSAVHCLVCWRRGWVGPIYKATTVFSSIINESIIQWPRGPCQMCKNSHVLNDFLLCVALYAEGGGHRATVFSTNMSHQPHLYIREGVRKNTFLGLSPKQPTNPPTLTI